MNFLRRFALLLLILGLLPTAGCALFTENNMIEEVAPITFLYIDSAGDNKLKVSTLVPPIVKEKKRMLSMEVDLLKQGRKNFNLKYFRELKLGQLRMLFISEAAARKGIQSFINILLSDPDVSNRMFITVVKGDFAKYIENQMTKPESLDYYLYRMFHHYEKQNQGEMTIVNVHQFLKEYYHPLSDPITPVFEATEKDFNYSGTALFRGDQFAGEIQGIDDQIFQLLDNRHFLKLMPLPALAVTLGHVRARPQISVDPGAKSLSIILNAQCRIEEYRGDKDLDKPEELTELNRKIEDYLEKETTGLLQKMQKMKVEPLRFGIHTRHPFSQTISEKEWQTLRDKLALNVDYRVRMRSQTQPETGGQK